jgi:hypothetical protein
MAIVLVELAIVRMKEYAGYTYRKELTLLQSYETAFFENKDTGLPLGGFAKATGIDIQFQPGPLRESKGSLVKEPEGAFVETLIAIVVDRLQYYQNIANKRFRCRENSLAITHLQEALHWLDHRTRDREARGVEGTHKP